LERPLEATRGFSLSTPVESCVEERFILQNSSFLRVGLRKILIEPGLDTVLSSPPPGTDPRSTLTAWRT